jgi:hypothetical protein
MVMLACFLWGVFVAFALHLPFWPALLVAVLGSLVISALGSDTHSRR